MQLGVSKFDRDVARRGRLARMANSEGWKSLFCIMRLADRITKECDRWEEAGKRRTKGGNDSKEWKESHATVRSGMVVVVVVFAESPNVESAWVTGQSSRRRCMWGAPCSVLALGSHTLTTLSPVLRRPKRYNIRGYSVASL